MESQTRLQALQHSAPSKVLLLCAESHIPLEQRKTLCLFLIKHCQQEGPLLKQKSLDPFQQACAQILSVYRFNVSDIINAEFKCKAFIFLMFYT